MQELGTNLLCLFLYLLASYAMLSVHKIYLLCSQE